jgi:hypothetical protein
MSIRVVDPKQKPRPFVSANSHVRLRHDYALWHPDHVDKVLQKTSPKIPFSTKSKFDSYTIALDVIAKSAEYPAILEDNGLFVTMFDVGYITGFDAKRNSIVSSATVVTKRTGEVVTAYPGIP